MTSWILVVGEGFEENWERAVDYQLWDLKKRRAIKRGDDVFFWQSPNRGFRGWTRAVTDSTDGTPDPRPWIPKDKTQYVQRFYFDVVSNTPVAGKWGDFFKNTTVKAGPNTAPVEVTNTNDEAYLRGLFLPTIDVKQVPVDVEVDLKKYAAYLSEDDRRLLANRLVSVREGQPAFRASLIAAYGGCCAITGTSVLPVLQAAHIAPYRGAHSNEVTNGILLRSDLHTLFDTKHLAITAQLRIEVDPELQESSYWEFNGHPLRQPAKRSEMPNAEALQLHYSSCHWTP
ncbi:HNH endonuclease [Rhodococcus sp. UNC363MFTsu5.1]|uniref:HNH endonuclease n=1 Tax=Rhodococcus sp. UNC363MFTsu5.1 TaxID=1449069 RepID=UPI0018CC3B4E|nr:HNH endonuclease [Rhodococcus sp. UNC363MFTsu5.1]